MASAAEKLENNGPYHSALNDTKAEKVVCGCGIYPLRTKHRGPASTKSDGEDILDEIIYYFKPNMLFKQYHVKGDADRTLLYLTLYIHHCLKKFKDKKQKDAKAELVALKEEKFSGPGDPGFILAGFIPAPKAASEGDEWKQYMKQCRDELAMRILDKVFERPESDGKANKYWMQFAHENHKFLGKELDKNRSR